MPAERNLTAIFVLLGALSGAAGVALGAFGAHALRSHMTLERQAVFETGVRYQLIHALALLFVGIGAGNILNGVWLGAAGWLFVVGTILFSGSLYLLVLSDRRWLGAITPFGGIALILGWLCLAASTLT
jgi:uncharacterized membrane protein YgdD (TMEM256/DUF423 family)